MALAALALGIAPQALATTPGAIAPEEVMRNWYRLVLELVRHTPTYSPPVASRAFAYLGVTAFEALASGSGNLQSLAGQLNGLRALPQRDAAAIYDEASVVDTAMAFAAKNFFSNTGPTGQRALVAMTAKMRKTVTSGLPADVIARSEAHGLAVGQHILAWSLDDGGAVVENMGFPLEYALTEAPGHWVPTSLVAQQQLPLLPNWAKNRTFATPNGAACGLPNPPAYSEDKGSDFYKEALEVYTAVKEITPEHRTVARFWSDDPMLSPTPPATGSRSRFRFLPATNTMRRKPPMCWPGWASRWPILSSAAGTLNSISIWFGHSPISAASSIRNGRHC